MLDSTFPLKKKNKKTFFKTQYSLIFVCPLRRTQTLMCHGVFWMVPPI